MTNNSKEDNIFKTYRIKMWETLKRMGTKKALKFLMPSASTTTAMVLIAVLIFFFPENEWSRFYPDNKEDTLITRSETPSAKPEAPPVTHEPSVPDNTTIVESTTPTVTTGSEIIEDYNNNTSGVPDSNMGDNSVPLRTNNNQPPVDNRNVPHGNNLNDNGRLGDYRNNYKPPTTVVEKETDTQTTTVRETVTLTQETPPEPIEPNSLTDSGV